MDHLLTKEQQKELIYNITKRSTNHKCKNCKSENFEIQAQNYNFNWVQIGHEDLVFPSDSMISYSCKDCGEKEFYTGIGNFNKI